MAIVSVRMEDETKKKFETFCDSVGITVSAAVNMFVKMTIREDRLPFDVKGHSFEPLGKVIQAKGID
ncbi:MAG: type II toxin-antitoxin system RelB/DinJ family antitoxin [Fibrobacter sp.]|nr:type II toxin-antitoxin system RelB/DinJ family antitoxin [Fibrobacter sp.]